MFFFCGLAFVAVQTVMKAPPRMKMFAAISLIVLGYIAYEFVKAQIQDIRDNRKEKRQKSPN